MLRILRRIFLALGMFLLVIAIFYLLPVGLPKITEMAVPYAVENLSANVLFVGDMFFDRYIRRVMETVGSDYVFSCIYPLLKEADFAIGNLEGPITNNPPVSVENDTSSADHFKFTFLPETANALARHNFGVVNLGNNHIGNFGAAGIAETKKFLDAAGVDYFGGLSGNEPVLQKEVSGIPLSFISYNQFGGDSPEEVAEKIAGEVRLGRVVIVYAHWGEEYSKETSALRETATRFSGAGANAIIGSHPHVVQSHEYIGNTLVFYSLGNFIFDQYWNEDVTQGLAVLLHITKDPDKKISFTEYSTMLTTDGRVCESEPDNQL